MPTDQQIARYTPNLILDVAASPQVDSSVQVVQVSDVKNMVLNPRGNAYTARGGLEIRRRYNVNMTGVPANKVVIFKDSQPPDVSLGNQFTVVDPNGGILDISYMRDRTQVEAAPLTYNIWFIIGIHGSNPASPEVSTDNYLNFTAIPTANQIAFDVELLWLREGDLQTAVTVRPVIVSYTPISGWESMAALQAQMDAAWPSGETIAGGVAHSGGLVYTFLPWDEAAPSATGSFQMIIAFEVTSGSGYTISGGQSLIEITGTVVP